MSAHCCEMMQSDLGRTCDQHIERQDCPDCLIDYRPSSTSYGLIVHDGGSSVIGINFCPWCGTKLSEADND